MKRVSMFMVFSVIIMFIAVMLIIVNDASATMYSPVVDRSSETGQTAAWTYIRADKADGTSEYVGLNRDDVGEIAGVGDNHKEIAPFPGFGVVVEHPQLTHGVQAPRLTDVKGVIQPSQTGRCTGGVQI